MIVALYMLLKYQFMHPVRSHLPDPYPDTDITIIVEAK